MADKFYCGKGWSKTFDNGGTNISVSVELDKVMELPVDQYGNVHLVVGQRKEVDPKSKASHWVAKDDYWYSKNITNEEKEETERQSRQPNDDLPF
jgi:hypothetical protein